jgi:hypothetical protein
LEFLSLIGAKENFSIQKRLEVNFVKEGFQVLALKSFPFAYPLNLLIGQFSDLKQLVFQSVSDY